MATREHKIKGKLKSGEDPLIMHVSKAFCHFIERTFNVIHGRQNRCQPTTKTGNLKD